MKHVFRVFSVSCKRTYDILPLQRRSIVERLCSDLIAKSRDINGLLYLLYFYFRPTVLTSWTRSHQYISFMP